MFKYILEDLKSERKLLIPEGVILPNNLKHNNIVHSVEEHETEKHTYHVQILDTPKVAFSNEVSYLSNNIDLLPLPEVYSLIYHLSHTDLDGFGCRALMHDYCTSNKTLYIPFHADYNEMDNILEKVMKAIKEQLSLYKFHETTLFITDLNLTLPQADKIHDFCVENDVVLQLVDHHMTGMDAFEKHKSWYYLEEGTSATMLLYRYLYEGVTSNKTRESFTMMVDSYDMYHRKSDHFVIGKSITSELKTRNFYVPNSDDTKVIVNEMKFALVHYAMINYHQIFRENLIENILNNYHATNHTIKVLFNLSIHSLQKLFTFVSIPELMEHYVSEILLNKTPNNFIIRDITYPNGVFKTLFVVNPSNSSMIYMVNDRFMIDMKLYDVLVITDKRGSMAFRSNPNTVHVGNLAKTYFGGGGHACAAGTGKEVHIVKQKEADLVIRDFQLELMKVKK